MKYPDDMDALCIGLCDCLNGLDGVRTFASCCGHCLTEYHILFRCDSMDSLSILSRACSMNYAGDGWRIMIDHTDTRPCLCFRLAHDAFTCMSRMEFSCRDLIERIRYAVNSGYLDYAHGKEDEP